MTHSNVWHDSARLWFDVLTYVCHDTFIRVSLALQCVSSVIHMYDSFICITHSYVWHESCTYVIRRVYICVRHDLFICVSLVPWHVPWLIYACDITDAHVWFDVLIHMCVMTHWFVCLSRLSACHDSCIRVTWLIHMCDMTHAHEGAYTSSLTFPHTCVSCLIHS